jgi:hypothetical protein
MKHSKRSNALTSNNHDCLRRNLFGVNTIYASLAISSVAVVIFLSGIFYSANRSRNELEHHLIASQDELHQYEIAITALSFKNAELEDSLNSMNYCYVNANNEYGSTVERYLVEKARSDSLSKLLEQSVVKTRTLTGTLSATKDSLNIYMRELKIFYNHIDSNSIKLKDRF